MLVPVPPKRFDPGKTQPGQKSSTSAANRRGAVNLLWLIGHSAESVTSQHGLGHLDVAASKQFLKVKMPGPDRTELAAAAQSRQEAMDFIEAFARMNVDSIRTTLSRSVEAALAVEHAIDLDWFSPPLLAASGLRLEDVNSITDPASVFLHIDAALNPLGRAATAVFLNLTGLSSKQQKTLFPILSTKVRSDPAAVAKEVSRLNAWLQWVRRDGFDASKFTVYQSGISTHGKSQNRTGAIGAAGAAIAFVDAILSVAPDAIVDQLGVLPPEGVMAPTNLLAWYEERGGIQFVLKALLLRNGRAIVFAGSKDANIFMPLGTPYASAGQALESVFYQVVATR